MAYGGPIKRSAFWIASTHLATTFFWGLASLLPFCCLARIFDEDAGAQSLAVDILGAALLVTVPLLIGLSASFRYLRRRAIIESARQPIFASNVCFCTLAGGMAGLALFRGTGIEKLYLCGILFLDTAIFCGLTQYAFRRMEGKPPSGFPVIVR